MDYFPSERRNRDGKAAECWPCKKSRDSEYIRNNKAHVRTIKRESAARAYITRGDEIRAAHRSGRYQEKYAKSPENRLKIRARGRVRDALRYGRITKSPCVSCGSTDRLMAHHHDYSKPLEVKWLCSTCHGKEHRVAAE